MLPDFARYYEILGLEPDCSSEEVKQAWRDLAQVWHPDRFPANDRLQKKAQDKLKEINEAFEGLKDLRPGQRRPTPERRTSKRRQSQWVRSVPDREAERDPLELLKSGVQAWNMWRKKYSDLTPRLAGVRLPRGDYTGVDLRDMDLSKSNFSDAALYKADLSGAKATGAVFTYGELSRATLIEVRFTRCNLSCADLSGVDLSRAHLVECDLRGANLVGTILDGARLETCSNLTAQQLEVVLSDGATRLPKP